MCENFCNDLVLREGSFVKVFVGIFGSMKKPSVSCVANGVVFGDRWDIIRRLALHDSDEGVSVIGNDMRNQKKLLLAVLSMLLWFVPWNTVMAQNRDECAVPAVEPLDTVCREHWTYEVIQELFRQGYASQTAGELVLNRALTRYEMALITANIAQDILRNIETAGEAAFVPDRIIVMVGDLVRYYKNELALLGIDTVDVFAQFGTYEPSTPTPTLPEIGNDEEIIESGYFELPPIGDGMTEIIGSFEDEELEDFLSGLEEILNEVPPMDNGDADSTGVAPIETGVTDSGQAVGGSSFEVHGGTKIEFIRRVVAGKPYELDENDKKVYIEPEEALRQSIWFTVTGRPNENVELTARIEGENQNGLMTDMSSLRIGSMSLIARTKHTEIWIGTLQQRVKLGEDGDEDIEGRTDGIRITYNGDKFDVVTVASMTKQILEDEDDVQTYFTRYNVSGNVVAHSLVQNWKFGLGFGAQWDDPFSTEHSTEPPSQLLWGRFTAEGKIGERTDISAMLEVQGYEKDITVAVPERDINLATGVTISHNFGNLSLQGSVYYVGGSYQPEDKEEGTTGPGGWRAGEYGIDVAAKYTALDGRMTIDGNAGYGVRALPETKKVGDEEITEYILHFQKTAGVGVSYGQDIVVNDKTYGSFNVGNRLTYTSRQREDNPDIWRQDITNMTTAGITLEFIENWINEASASFTYSGGAEGDGTGNVKPIDEKHLALGFTTSYTWTPTDGLAIVPRYSFNYDRDFGIEPVHAVKHLASVGLTREVVPSVLVVSAVGQLGYERIYATTFDEDGEPEYGRSNTSYSAEIGVRYTPEWFKGFGLTASLGKKNVNYIDDDIIATGASIKPTQDSWIIKFGADYATNIGNNTQFGANYNLTRIIDEVEEYDDTIHNAGISGAVKIGEIVTVSGNYNMQISDEKNTRTASLTVSTDLGPNTEFGVSWSRRATQDKTDPSKDELVDELRAFFAGSF